jgi:putative hemolysin
VEIQETEMRKFLIVASLASLAGGVLTEAAAAATVQMSQSELKAYCDKKGGMFNADRDGAGSNCTIGVGKNQVVIVCTNSGNCSISHTMVFSSKPATHGPVGQAPDTTLGKGGKNSAGASTSATSTLAGGGTSSNGVATAKQAPLAGASNTNTSGTTGGGGLPPTGRPRLQQQ